MRPQIARPLNPEPALYLSPNRIQECGGTVVLPCFRYWCLASCSHAEVPGLPFASRGWFRVLGAGRLLVLLGVVGFKELRGFGV